MHSSSRLFSKYINASHAPRQTGSSTATREWTIVHKGIIAIVAESLYFAKNDRLQQHNTRPSGLNQIHVLYWTVCTAGQYGLLYYSIVQSTVVQYSTVLCLCLGVISNPNHTHRIFSRISNNFDCPSALKVDTVSMPRPSQPMRTTFGALPAAQAPRSRTGCENVCETFCILSGVALFQLCFFLHYTIWRNPFVGGIAEYA